MFLKKNTNNMRSLLTVFAVFALAVTVLWWSANNSTTNASDKTGDENNAPEATFAANPASLGAIPDSDVTTVACQNNSTTMRDVTFPVTGLSGSVQNVSVSFSASHTYLQDLEVTLIAPTGQSHLLFSATGTTTTTANSCTGSSSDLLASNTYTFSDAATANWWTTAATNPVPTSTNRTVVSGIGGTTNPPAVTSLNAAFASVTNANGTWTLRFRDRGAGDTGSVTAANLTVNTAGVTRGTLFDFTGSNRTDFTVFTLPTTGPITWKTAANPASPVPNQAFIRIFNFGQNTGVAANNDIIVPYDFTGDAKSEVSVWRPGSPGIFYTGQFLNGTSGTMIDSVTRLGQPGDDPRAVGDYDGDGKIDYTVQRFNNTTGVFTWFMLNSATSTFRQVSVMLPAETAFLTTIRGVKGADFNGDGRDELVFLSLDADTLTSWFAFDSVTGAYVFSRQFGDFDSDYVISPADYTGDGRADLVAVRQAAQGQVWYINNSATNVTTATQFGLSDTATARLDDNLRGDFDGDGRQDIGVWRRSNQTFYWINSSNGSLQSQQWGAAGDRPIGFDGVF